MLIGDAPVFILWKWPVASALCDVSDHLLLFFTVRTSWGVHAVKANEYSRKTIASMLSDSLNCPHLRLHRGIPHRQTPPSSKYKERVRDKFSGKRELAHRSSLVVNVPL
ncbi:hypothetical protein CDL15_Pgr000869 [Punica granatum]|uniref:Uncharacterized protein n=1 Tax=Punica granatum TaxID=22663 RepID=A0A218Y0K5_PUNGR|nr:hypothetical protein CDL15_Pgr000869 [Punica granatum]